MADGQMIIVGALGKDPELRFTATGRGVCSFTVAVSHRYKAQDATEWTEETAWVDVTAWGTLGENVAASLSKGTRVVCVGRLKQDDWEDRDTGAKRSKLTLVADSVGPDLRWATCQVERLERTKTGGDPF